MISGLLHTEAWQGAEGGRGSAVHCVLYRFSLPAQLCWGRAHAQNTSKMYVTVYVNVECVFSHCVSRLRRLVFGMQGGFIYSHLCMHNWQSSKYEEIFLQDTQAAGHTHLST